MQEKSPRLQAALELAQAGIPVFPCLPNAKEPATEHGFLDATTDLGQIERWWQEADYNVAFAPAEAGWSVVDPDGAAGAVAWEKLTAEHSVPPTFTVKTPHGRHYYFDGDLPMSAWSPGAKRTLGEHIDTRGTTLDGRPGAYVLYPPSVVEGIPYVTERNIDLAPVPAWAVARLAPTYQRLETVAGEADTALSLRRARAFLSDCVERGDIAVEGRGGNNRTYQLACSLQNLGLGAEQAFELILELWSPSCVPPWEPEELAPVVEHAYAYAQNAAGAWAVEPLSESFKEALDQLPKPPAEARSNPFHWRDLKEQRSAVMPAFMIPGLIPDRATVLITGASGAFKSFIALDIACAIASKTVTFGQTSVRTGRVLYATNEGLIEIGMLRCPAWQQHRGLADAQLDNFHTVPCPRIINEGEVGMFKAEIRAQVKLTPLAAIFLDTVTKCMAGLDENNPRDASLMVAFMDDLRDEFNCPVIALNHFGKGAEVTGGKGSSVLPAGIDTLIEVRRIPETLAVEVKVVQHKDAETPKAPWTFEGIPVGRSLVFDPTTREQHGQHTMADERFTREKVAAALVDLGAIGIENAVTSHVLASSLAPAGENRTEEERLDGQKRTARSLEGLGRKSLAGYNYKAGKTFTWFVPASVAEGVKAAVSKQEPQPE